MMRKLYTTDKLAADDRINWWVRR